MSTSEIAHARNDAPAPSSRLQLALVVPSLTNPRKHFEPAALAELAESIKQLDVAQPILVRRLPAARLQETFTDRRKGDALPTHEIVAGERRYRAAKLAGLESIPYLERELTDDQVLHIQIVENLLREGLHPLEEAEGYRRILDLPSQGDKPMRERIAALAGEIKKSTRYIYTTLQLLQLCDFAREIFMRPHVMPRSIALQIATIGNEAGQIEATKRICGLVKDGKEWVQGDAGLTQREALQHVRDNYRLVLSKAPFPIAVVFAGEKACGECEKNTDNAQHLVEEGAKVPATCTDPSCYGRKNAAHANQVAEAAKKAGQKVISGKEAKKHAPWEGSPEHLAHTSEYQPLDERRYDASGKHYGKTVRQLLGADMPKPTLIQRADGKGFIEALPKKEIDRLLKERGMLSSATRYTKPESQRKAEEKARREREWREEAAQQVLAGVAKQANQDKLRSQLLLYMANHMYEALGHDTSKKVQRLMQWDIGRAGSWNSKGRDKFLAHFQSLDGAKLNQFIVATLIADEIHGNTHGGDRTQDLQICAGLIGLDLKAIKSAIEAKHKEKAAAKKAPAKKAAAKGAKKPSAKPAAAPAKKTAAKPAKKVRPPAGAFMKPLHLTPELEAITGPGPMPRTEIVSKMWQYIKKHKLNDTANKRMVNIDEKLRAVFGNRKQVSMFEMAGLIGKHAADKPAAAAKKAEPTTNNAAPAADGIAAAVGCQVKIKDGIKGPTGHLRKICGRKGKLTKKLAGSEWMFMGEGSKDSARVKTGDFVVIAEAAAPAPKVATKAATGKASKKDGAIGQGELELSDGTKLSPQKAWPFPTAKQPEAATA